MLNMRHWSDRQWNRSSDCCAYLPHCQSCERRVRPPAACAGLQSLRHSCRGDLSRARTRVMRSLGSVLLGFPPSSKDGIGHQLLSGNADCCTVCHSPRDFAGVADHPHAPWPFMNVL